jgi:class 3 adenylate cyclase
MRISLRLKLLLSFTGIILVVVAIVTVSVSRVVENRIRADITRNFQETGQIFERIQEIRFRLLYQTATLISDIPNLKGVISTKDEATITAFLRDELAPIVDFDPVLSDSLVEFAGYLNPDSLGILMVVDRDGYPMGQLASSELPRHSLADRPGIRTALAGDYPDLAYLWEQDGRWFTVLSVPVWAGNDVMGVLSLGYPIRQLEAEQLSRDTGSSVAFLIDSKLVVDAFDMPSEADVLSRAIHSASFDVVSRNEAVLSETAINGDDWLLYVARMLPESNGFYAVGRSLTLALDPVRDLQRIILFFGLGALILAVGVSFWLTSRINRPIQLLIQGIQRIEGGDYGQDVPITTNDELRHLTETFNRLVTGLRERLQMLKFVSKSTLEAIQNNLSSVQPGGERKEVTVFFSDVRGFTRWSEKRAPEEVIDMLNTCLRFQADIVKEFGGDVDKFVGDELVAVFEGDKKEANAVNAAIRILSVMDGVMGDHPDIAIGVGINTGEVVMGAVGSHDRMDYTVIGNHVNLGARLCSSAKPGQILISQPVFERLERRIQTLELDPISVKGIEKPVRIYEILTVGKG